MRKIFIYGIALMGTMLFAACHNNHNHEEEGHAEGDKHEHTSDEIALTPEQARAGGIRTETVQPADFAEVTEVSGRVLPAQGGEVTVAATMAGIVRLSAGSLSAGAPVRAGQPLFTINAQPMADGNPAAVAHAELTAAHAEYGRAERLAKDGIVSQRELEGARQRLETAKATARSLGSASQIRGVAASIGGYVKDVFVKPGDYVSAGQPLAVVAQSRRVQLRADVPERYFGRLARITSAHFKMAYDEGDQVLSLEELGGRLVSKGRNAESGGFSVPVIFELNNQGSIVPGSLAEVWLIGAVRRGVISVPKEAVTEAQGLYFVYVQTHGDAYRRQEVRLGSSDGLRVEIVEGLKAGDKVVTRGVTQVRLAAASGNIPEGHQH